MGCTGTCGDIVEFLRRGFKRGEVKLFEMKTIIRLEAKKKNRQDRKREWIYGRQKMSFRLSCGFSKANGAWNTISRRLGEQKVRCLCRSAAMFLQAETAVDPQQCFSSVYTKSDGVLNTGRAASPRDKVGLAAILLRHHPPPPPPPSLTAVRQVVIPLQFADGCRLQTPQLSPLC